MMGSLCSRAFCVAMLCFSVCVDSSATTWGKTESIPDPIKKGATCEGAQPMSYGSYIYQWPSKYDQVFWPLIDEHVIWFCAQSGFAAFMGDFELTDEEKVALSEHLALTYRPKTGPAALKDKLQQLQMSYANRNKDEAFNIRLLRVLAHFHENDFQDVATAARLRKGALAMIETALAGNLPEQQRLEYLFVSAAYHREFGDAAKSGAAAAGLRDALKAASDEKLKDYVEYLTELTQHLERIVPGGLLAPDERR